MTDQVLGLVPLRFAQLVVGSEPVKSLSWPARSLGRTEPTQLWQFVSWAPFLIYLLPASFGP